MRFWERQKFLHSFYEASVAPVCQKYQLTYAELNILLFLYHYPKCNTAADIVRMRQLAKSHVSTALKSLESKGLITRSHPEDNQKIVNLSLTDSAHSVLFAGRKAQRVFLRNIFDGFSKEEFQTFEKLMNRVCKNAEKGLKTPIIQGTECLDCNEEQ